ncbi:MAG: class I SAM-dependent methyltransferase, partial [Patescibacteria group bacterium]
MNQASLRKYFDLLAPKRDLWRRRNFYYHKTLTNLCQFLIPNNSNVLEIGCGTGELLKSVNPIHGKGVDISPRMIEIASKKYPDISWLVSNTEDASNLEESFDYILMSDLVGYLEDIETSFREIRRLCRSNTRLIITYS